MQRRRAAERDHGTIARCFTTHSDRSIRASASAPSSIRRSRSTASRMRKRGGAGFSRSSTRSASPRQPCSVIHTNSPAVNGNESVSALDLSIQAQILNLLVDLKKDFGLAYLFISHDLSVVRYFADRVLVMYLGRIVESADHATLWRNPSNPYTRALLASIPSAKLDKRPAAVLTREAGQGIRERGCRFRVRCPVAVKQCETDDPVLRKLPDGSAVACHLAYSADTPSYENESGAKRYHDQHGNDRL